MAPVDPALLDLLRERLAARPEVLEAYLFGSQARGDARVGSDLDIAVYVDRERMPPVPFGYAADLLTDLMAVRGLPRIDAVILNDAPPLLYHRVLRDGQRLLSRDHPPRGVRPIALLRLPAAAPQDRPRVGSAPGLRQLRKVR